MKTQEVLTVSLALAVACLMLSSGAFALATTVTQSGADSDEVMKDSTFIVEASGWTGDCSTATLSFAGCSSCSLSGEELTKSIGGEASSISWTTVSASNTASAQTVSVSVSSGCTLQQATSSSFDIVLPPAISLSASTAASSVESGSSFTANLNIDNNGETTAQSVSISAASPFSTSCTAISSIDEGQSAAKSCTISASGSAGSKTVTLTATPTNGDSDSDSFTITVTGGGGEDDDGDGGGGSSGGAGAGTAENKSSRPSLVPGVGLRNNTKLQAAIEKVLAKGKMSEQAIQNMLRLSASITAEFSNTRNFNDLGSRSRITSMFRYTGQQRITNMVVYESVPKSFASNASLVTVNAPGATVEIAEEDPSWVIVYPEVNPNDELTVTYEVSGSKDSDVIDDMGTEIYAEAVEDIPTTGGEGACTPGTQRCTGNDLEMCASDGQTWSLVETCQHGCNAQTLACNAEPAGPEGLAIGELPWMWIIVAVIIIVVIIAGLAVYRNMSKNSSRGIVTRNRA